MSDSPSRAPHAADSGPGASRAAAAMPDDAAAILAAAPVGLLVVGADGRIVGANGEAGRLLRHDAAGLAGRPVAVLRPHRSTARVDRVLARAGRQSAAAPPRRFWAVLTRGDGTPMDAELAVSPVGDGTRRLAIGLDDVGPRRRLEAELRATGIRAGRASQAKNAFLANVSHELRTPLNAILGFSDILKEELFGPLSLRYRGYADDIHASAGHLLGLVDDLLDLSKIEAGATELAEQTVAIDDLLDEVARMLAPDADRAGVTVEAETQDGLPPVRADRRQLRQVLLNLVGNSVKYSEAGEAVRLSALRLADGGMAMVVTDTGIGIAVADQERALTPYGRIGGRLDSRGAGLGLPIAKAMIERHGGRMFLNSDLGAGTSVFVTLPADRVVSDSLPGDAFVDPATLSDPVAGMRVRSFAGHDLDEIEALTPADLDRLPVGVVRLDRAGRVLSYNAVESRYSGLKPEAVIGRDFFREIAPCTAGSVFERTFREGMASGRLDALLEYVFAFPGRPMRVAVQMRTGRDPDTAWIFVRWV